MCVCVWLQNPTLAALVREGPGQGCRFLKRPWSAGASLAVTHFGQLALDCLRILEFKLCLCGCGWNLSSEWDLSEEGGQFIPDARQSFVSFRNPGIYADLGFEIGTRNDSKIDVLGTRPGRMFAIVVAFRKPCEPLFLFLGLSQATNSRRSDCGLGVGFGAAVSDFGE
jgi:hypothetical protein